MPQFAIWQFFHLIALFYWIGGLVFLGFYLLPRWVLQEHSAKSWALLQQAIQAFSFGGIFAALLLLLSGYAMVMSIGGFAQLGVAIWIMVVLGTITALGAFHLNFAPLKRLRRALDGQDWAAAAKALRGYGIFARFLAALALILTFVGVLGVYL
ncbi:hypothetical protein AB4090_04135 [Acidithiobacillus sp. IBUN Pt1247-S3]|uniref:hypothetical protein n=1 Tax=Acidithiobacillus sp. IBUN Pt1247-S3 TaxID=3166642 RepID=UPI0034E4884B